MNKYLKTSLVITVLQAAVLLPASTRAQQNENLEQWAHERFGMFIHWGVYSGPAGVWHGKTCQGYYAEHLMRHFRIPLEVYKKEVVSVFNPIRFDAGQWVRILKDAGMGYMVITAKHHDGFAMYDSDVTDYDIIDATPFDRDPMKELKEACMRNDVLFGFYYSHAQDWSHPQGLRNDWDFNGPANANWHKNDSSYYPEIEAYYYDRAIPQLVELIQKYDPDILWFDQQRWAPAYLNRACVDTILALKPDLLVNSRAAGDYRASYSSTNDKPVEFPHREGYWEAVPTTNQSYGYHRLDHTHHPPSYLIRLIIKAAAKGGNMLMNVGPKGDGTIDMADQGILAEIGKWMETNGESIKGTTGNPLTAQSFGEITRKGNTLYCHIFQWPDDGKLVVSGLTCGVKKAFLLTHPERTPLEHRRLNDLDIEISVPEYPQERVAAVLAIECEEIDAQGDRILLLQNVAYNRLHATEAELSGDGLNYAGGNWRTDYLKGWDHEDATVKWKLRSNTGSEYDVFISYDAQEQSDGNEFEIRVGEDRLNGTVITGVHRDDMYMGRVNLPEGTHELVVSPIQINDQELMRLRDIKLVPIN